MTMHTAGRTAESPEYFRETGPARMVYGRFPEGRRARIAKPAGAEVKACAIRFASRSLSGRYASVTPLAESRVPSASVARVCAPRLTKTIRLRLSRRMMGRDCDQEVRRAFLHRAERAQTEPDRQRLAHVAMDECEPVDIAGFEPADFARAMQRHARLCGWLRPRLAHHAVSGIAQAAMPVVIDMPVLLALTDHQAVVSDRLVRVANQIRVGGIQRRHVIQVIFHASGIEIGTGRWSARPGVENSAPRKSRPGCQ